MASKSDRRRQQKREKKRLKDKQRRGAARRQRRASKVHNIAHLQQLPVGECFASEHWYEHGAPSVWAAFSCVHPNDSVAAAIFHLDLRERGVVSVEIVPELPAGQLAARLGQLGQGQVIRACEPELVAALVSAAQDMHLDSGRPLPSDFADAVALMDDVDPDECPHEILTGPPPEEPSKKPAGPGLLATLKGWLGARRSHKEEEDEG